jgi:hypothetical protein
VIASAKTAQRLDEKRVSFQVKCPELHRGRFWPQTVFNGKSAAIWPVLERPGVPGRKR